MWIGSPANSLAGSAAAAGPVAPLNSSLAASCGARLKIASLRPMRLASAWATSKFDRASPCGLAACAAPLHPVGAVGAIEIVGLEVVRRRQHDVGVLRRVGHEGIVHHGEQVLARKTLLHLVDLGAGHRRIVGRHVERADRRVLHVQKLFAQAQVIDVARRGRPRGPADGGVVEIARRRGQQQRAAALHGVVARHARQQRHGAQRLAAMRRVASCLRPAGSSRPWPCRTSPRASRCRRRRGR